MMSFEVLVPGALTRACSRRRGNQFSPRPATPLGALFPFAGRPNGVAMERGSFGNESFSLSLKTNSWAQARNPRTRITIEFELGQTVRSGYCHLRVLAARGGSGAPQLSLKLLGSYGTDAALLKERMRLLRLFLR